MPSPRRSRAARARQSRLWTVSPSECRNCAIMSRSCDQAWGKLGFDIHSSPTAIIPVMIGDEAEAIAKSKRCWSSA